MLNHVPFIGHIADAGSKLTYSDTGRSECRWTLAIEEPGMQGKVFTTNIPCSAWEKAVNTGAESIKAGNLVCIQDAPLKFRSALVNGEKVSKLEVSC